MRHFRSFFKKKIFKKIFKFYFVPSRKTVIFQSYRAWKAHFGCLQSVFKAFHEYVLSIFRKLCASWALDIAPTLDVPVLFFSQRGHKDHTHIERFTLLHIFRQDLMGTQRSRFQLVSRNLGFSFNCNASASSHVFINHDEWRLWLLSIHCIHVLV